MGVKTQVSGNKVQSIQASKNLGTVVNTQVSGEKSNGQLGYRKITNQYTRDRINNALSCRIFECS